MNIDHSLLKKSFGKFQNMEFPRDTQNEKLSDLHAELAEYDGYIAGMIDSLISGRRIEISNLNFDVDLKKKLEEFISEGDKNFSSEAKQYLSYLESIGELIELAKKEQSTVS